MKKYFYELDFFGSKNNRFMGFEALKMQRFLLQEDEDSEGESVIWQWEDGLDDNVRDLMDFTLIYANNIEEAINQFKSLK